MNNVIDLRKFKNPPADEKEQRLEMMNINMRNVVDLRYANNAPSPSVMRKRPSELEYAKNIMGNTNSEEKSNQEEKILIEQSVGEENFLTAEEIQQYVNPQRRQLLNLALIGTGAFVLGLIAKAFGFPNFFKPKVNKSEILATSLEPEKIKLESDFQKIEFQKEAEFKNWKVVERKKGELVFIDKEAREEVLILDL